VTCSPRLLPLGLVDVAVGSAPHLAALVVEQVLHFGTLYLRFHLEVVVHFA